jgi:starch synthase
MKILFAASEITPFAKTGGLADVAAALPKALHARGHDVRLMLPFYGQIDAERFAIKPMGIDLTVPLGGAPRQGSLYTTELDGLPVYLIRNDLLFGRDGLYGYGGGDHADNALRFGFFCRALLQALPRLDFAPDIIHAHDWQTALLPTLLRHEHGSDPFFTGTGSLLTLHNLGYQGLFPSDTLATLSFDPAMLYDGDFEYHGQLSLLKSGIINADGVTTVSPTYSREVCTPEQGMGFDGILKQRGSNFIGILNGIDTRLWNPAGDSALVRPYAPGDLNGKAVNKAALQQQFGLHPAPHLPLVAMVSRLDRHKGFDLLEAAWSSLVKSGLQLLLIGNGTPDIESRLAALARQTPRQTAAFFAFDDSVARRAYAGSDFFLMPSHYEPCGLAQLIALRYGSIPVVRRTGGLADTIIDVTAGADANGIVFDAATPAALLAALDRASHLLADPVRRKALVVRGMTQDLSWDGPARQYEAFYQQILEKRS